MTLFGEAKREYARKWVATRRASWMADKFCVKCGRVDNLEIHHLDPTQKVSHSVWSWSQIKRDAELAKCVVLCHDCHAVETALQAFNPLVHGTRAGYETHKCRCFACVEAASIRREKQRLSGGRKHQKSYKASVAQLAQQDSCTVPPTCSNQVASSNSVEDEYLWGV